MARLISRQEAPTTTADAGVTKLVIRAACAPATSTIVIVHSQVRASIPAARLTVTTLFAAARRSGRENASVGGIVSHESGGAILAVTGGSTHRDLIVTTTQIGRAHV